jgi:hypothetical protein
MPQRQVVPQQPLSVSVYLPIDAALSLISLGRVTLIPLLWLAIWPALAFGVALVALRGVGAVAQANFIEPSVRPTREGWE